MEGLGASGGPHLAELLDEQLTYYRERADEYHAMVTEIESSPTREVIAAGPLRRLEELAPLGRVLELAAGTGMWTKALARRATALTAIDGSPEMLEHNRRNPADPRVHYAVADLFAWQPQERYDLVFFGFRLSHVPPARFDEFWAKVEQALVPGGRFFCVDTHWDPDAAVATGPEVMTTLGDGRQFRIVKVLYQPDELARQLKARGWAAEATAIDGESHYATGTRR